MLLGGANEMKLVLWIALGSFFCVACASQDEIVAAKTPAMISSPTTTTAAQASGGSPGPSDFEDQVAARRKAQDDADWAQAQRDYQAQQQQMN
jgi:hypothetical protein